MKVNIILLDGDLHLGAASRQVLTLMSRAPDATTQALVSFIESEDGSNPPDLIADTDAWPYYRPYLINLKLAICLAGLEALDAYISDPDITLRLADRCNAMKDKINNLLETTDRRTRNQ